MGKIRAILALALLSALIIITVPIGVKAQWTLIWEANVPSTGGPVPSPVLDAGREYLIVAKGAFVSAELDGTYSSACDAQNYTDSANPPGTMAWWIWDPALTYPAPGGHSFLQINGMDVYWGPFSNGDINWGGHEYSISYVGTGAPIIFAIVDWVDGSYVHNYCNIHVKIYEGPLVPPVGETAFAYGGEYATCFLSLGFKSWGWSNGPLGPGFYEFDIYAGAAKCDITKGTLVGTLEIDYDGSTATVTYKMNAGWAMDYTQLYVGSEVLPRDRKNEYTVSPGQYPSIHYSEGGATIDTHTVSGLSGDIYVVAHADVFEV